MLKLVSPTSFYFFKLWFIQIETYICGSHYIFIAHRWYTDFSNLLPASNLKCLEDISENGVRTSTNSLLHKNSENTGKKIAPKVVGEAIRLIKKRKRKNWGIRWSQGVLKVWTDSWDCRRPHAFVRLAHAQESVRAQESTDKFLTSHLAEFESLCKQEVKARVELKTARTIVEDRP